MSKLTACSLGVLAFLLSIGGSPQAFAQSGPNEQINQIGQPSSQKQSSQPTQQSQSTTQTQSTTQKQRTASRPPGGQQQPTTEQQIQRDIKQYVPQQYQQYLGAAEGGGVGSGR